MAPTHHRNIDSMMATSRQYRNKDEYIARMERELTELRSKLAVSTARGGSKGTKANLIRSTCLSPDDILFTKKIWDYCIEYLFTRIKFLPKGWKVYDPNKTNNFAGMIEKHIQVAPNLRFEDEWYRIMIDAIISKYSDMRCNVNNHMRDTFKGEYSVCSTLLLFNTSRSHITYLLLIADPRRALLDPDELAKGVGYFSDQEELNTLMEFLARYVRVVHCNRFFMNKLFLNKGRSYVEILTPSDIAFAICLLKNSIGMWRHKMANNGDAGNTKPLFSAGEGKKREHGETVWSKEGLRYFKETQRNWMEAFVRGSRDYHILELYWKEWINDEGKTYMIGDEKGMKQKSAHSVLRTREQWETVKGAGKAKKVVQMEEEEEEEEEFVHESDDDDNGIVDVGMWSACKRGGRRRVQEEDDEDNDEDAEANENDDDYGNEDNNEVGGEKECDDEESEDMRTEEDSGDLNEIQHMIEEEAVAAGLTRHGGKRGRGPGTVTRTSPRRAGKKGGKSNSKKRQKFGQVVISDPQRKSKRGRVPKNFGMI
jgi:hypothetical protein